MAALAMLPVAIPLLYRLVLAENRAGRAELYATNAQIGLTIDQGHAPPLDRSLYTRAIDFEGNVLVETGDDRPDPSFDDLVCNHPWRVLALDQDATRTGACFETRDLRVISVFPTPRRSYVGIGVFSVATAIIAGLVTALGVLTLLRPLGRMGQMLDQVTMGASGARMRGTGVREIDQLIERMNGLASAVAERENAILGQVQVAQEMARLVAHEVRNPLQSMELLTSLLADESDPTERRELSQSIHAEIRTLDDVVTRLLREGATRGSLRLHLQEEDVGQLLQHVARMKAGDAERKGVQIEVIAEGPGDARLDRPLMSRSIENLVNNALRAVPREGGRVRLSVGGTGSHVRIAVEDNGPGIDPELGPAVFEVNVSGAGGSGLGLSLTKGVAEAHGGRVHFERSGLGGARFVIEIPRRPAPPANTL